jgi:cytochrome c5
MEKMVRGSILSFMRTNERNLFGRLTKEDNSVAVFNSSIVLRFAQMGALAASVVFMGASAAQSRDEQIAERLKPVGEVCLAGQPCARGGAAPVAAASAAPAASGAFDVEQTYQTSCNVCHASGMAGAPKFDDNAEWAKRLADKGLETLVANAINGINAMPARGMCMTCSDDNIAELVEYISGHGQ